MIPIFMACLLVYLALKSGLIPPPEARIPYYQQFLTFDTGVQSFLRFTLYDVFFAYPGVEYTYIAPLWTMPIELLCSYALLVVLWMLGPWRWRTIVMALFSIGCFFAFSYNLGFFFAGALLAQWYYRRSEVDTGIGVTFALFVGGVIVPLLSMHPLALLGSALLLMVAVLRSEQLQQLLQTRLSRFLGRIAFPLYLVHELLICTVGLRLAPYVRNSADLLAIDLAVIAGSIGLACVFAPVNRWAILVSRWVGKYAAEGYGRLFHMLPAIDR